MKAQAFLVAALLFMSCGKEDMTEPGALVPRTVDQDQSLPSIIVNGTMLHAEAAGDPSDPMVVVLHGGPGGDYRSMTSAKSLADKHYYVVFYDQRGTGLSKREDKAVFEQEGTIDLYIADLDAVIRHFRTSGSQKVFLLGHSWGAMLATGYVNRYPGAIAGLVLAEPGGLTWTQAKDYIGRANTVRLFNEALNDALYPEQLFSGRDEHEVLDYKASFFFAYENAPGNAIGNAGPYPFWRSGAACFQGMLDHADQYGFDFTANLHQYTTPVLFLYSELSTAYGYNWALQVSAPFPHVDIEMVKGTGHEMLYFGWNAMYPLTLTYLNSLR